MGQNFTRNWLAMFSVSQVGKNAYRVGKTNGLLTLLATAYSIPLCHGGGVDSTPPEGKIWLLHNGEW